MASAVQARLSGLGKDESGSIGMLLGLSFLIVSFCAGMGIDMALMSSASSRVTAAADAAALAAGRALLEGKLDDAAVADIGEKMFWADFKSSRSFAEVSSATVNVNRATGTITVDVAADVKMTMTALAGFKKFDIPVHNAATFKSKDIEVGMALDITGSMADVPSGGGVPKIKALKAAFAKFADQLLPTNPVANQKVRIALAPFATSVNLGSYSGAATGNRSKDGCATERTTSDKYSDAAAGAGDYFTVKADGVADIDPTEGTSSNAYYCPSPTIMPLSSDHDALIAKVNTYTPNGGTAGHLGIQWGWNLISENWGSVWGSNSAPDSYQQVQDGKLIKAVVLMTDGIFNTAYHNDWSSKQALALCSAMKSKGVAVFTIAFDAPASAQTTLKACATSPTDYYADASNDVELEAAFAKFASKLGELHLSR